MRTRSLARRLVHGYHLARAVAAADTAGPLVAAVRAMPGVSGVLDLRWTAAAPPTEEGGAMPAVARCADLRATGLCDCPDPSATVGLDARRLELGYLQRIGTQPSMAVPDRLPLLALLVSTDGRSSTMESVRAAIETATAASSDARPHHPSAGCRSAGSMTVTDSPPPGTLYPAIRAARQSPTEALSTVG